MAARFCHKGWSCQPWSGYTCAGIARSVKGRAGWLLCDLGLCDLGLRRWLDMQMLVQAGTEQNA